MFTEKDLDEMIKRMEEITYKQKQVPFFIGSAYKEYNNLQTDEEKEKWLDDNYLKRWYWEWVVV